MKKILISTLVLAFAFSISVSATVTTPSNKLTVLKSGDGYGSVTGANGGAITTASYATGTAVTLKAAPLSGSTFTGWSNGCTGMSTTCTVTLGTDKIVQANFSKTSRNTLTVSKSGTGTGSIVGVNAIDTYYATGTAVTLRAVAAAGSVFAGWSSACTGTSTSCAVTMNTNKSVIAIFNRTLIEVNKYSVTLAKSGSGSGTIRDSSDVDLSAGRTVKVTKGEVIKFKAVPAEGSTFVKWTGACDGTNNTCTVTVNNDKTVTAQFTQTVKNLTSKEIKDVNTSCAKAALEKRDARIIPALEKYTKDWINTIQTRTSAQKNAYEKKGNERISAINASNTTRKSAQSKISKELTSAKQAANASFKLEMRACGYTDGIDED